MAKENYSLTGRYRGAKLPEVPGIEVEVIRITSTENRIFCLCSTMPWVSWWHWGGKSLRCTDNLECDRCKTGIPRKIRGYIHAIEFLGTAKREVIIELTHTAMVMIDVALCGQPHRGCMVLMKKTKGGKHGRFVIDVKTQRIDAATLPDERDPEPLMLKLWAFNERRDGPGVGK